MVQLIKAARGNINTQHGEQIGRGFPHVGIDIGWGGGLELYAPAAGWLSWSWAGTYGNLAVITHDDGTRSRIAHADTYIGFNGRRVEQGEYIGTMGKSGGPWGTSGWFVHCHQEYWVDGRAVDPTDYMGSTPAGEESTPIQGDDMYDADAEGRLMAKLDYTLGVIRRESRARWYKNSETGQEMVVKIPDGFLLDINSSGQIESLKQNGYLLIASEEKPQLVDNLRWNNIRGEVDKHLDRIATAVAGKLAK